MAIYDQGFLGRFLGKLGPAVGATWRGKNVIKAMPKKSSKPPTQKQLVQQATFSLAVKLVSGLDPFIKYGYQNSGDITPANAAVKQVLRDAIIGLFPAISIDHSKVLISKGGLQMPEAGEMVIQPNGIDVKVSWEEPLDAVRATDIAMIVFHDTVNGYFKYSGAQVFRSALTTNFRTTTLFEGHEVVAWIFFRSADGKLVSNSEFLGKIVIPIS